MIPRQRGEPRPRRSVSLPEADDMPEVDDGIALDLTAVTGLSAARYYGLGAEQPHAVDWTPPVVPPQPVDTRSPDTRRRQAVRDRNDAHQRRAERAQRAQQRQRQRRTKPPPPPRFVRVGRFRWSAAAERDADRD